MNNLKKKAVLLTDASYLSTLDAARQLGKEGVKVVVADPKRFRISVWSKYVSYIKSPDMTNTEEFLAWLKTKSKEGIFTLILPTSDLMVWYLSSRRAKLNKYFDTFIPSARAVEATLFKNVMYKICKRYNIGTPTCYFPKSYDDVKNLADTIKYPVIIKHNTTVCIQREKKGEVVYSKDELIQKYKKDNIAYDKKEILDRFRYVEWPMIQEYIPNAVDNLFCIMGLAINNGKVITAISIKKVRQEPPKIGIGICAKPSHNLKAIKEVIKFIKAVKYSGNFGVEVLYDKRDRKYKIIDFNPRVTGLANSATCNGLNIPSLWYGVLSGKKHLKNKIVRGHKFHIHLISDLLYLPGNLIHAPNKLKAIKELFKSYLGPKKLAVFSLDDPMPFIIDVLMTIRNKVKHPLFYLREIWKGE